MKERPLLKTYNFFNTRNNDIVWKKDVINNYLFVINLNNGDELNFYCRYLKPTETFLKYKKKFYYLIVKSFGASNIFEIRTEKLSEYEYLMLNQLNGKHILKLCEN